MIKLGQWKVETRRPGDKRITVADEHGNEIATLDCDDPPFPPVQVALHATLISLAPRMLAALKAARPWLADHVAATCDDDFAGVGDRISLDEVDALVALVAEHWKGLEA